MIIVIGTGLALGLILQIFLKSLLNWYSKQQAESLAKDLIETAEEKAEELMDLAKESIAEFERSQQESHEKLFDQKEERIQKLQGQVDQLRNQLHNKWMEKKKVVDRSYSLVQNHANLVDTLEAKARLNSASVLNKKKDLAQKLIETFSLDKEKILSELSQKIVNIARTKINENLSKEEEDLKDRIERDAKNILNLVINRFVRPFCPERGIGFIVLKNDSEVEKMLGPNKSHIEHVEKYCGVDIIYNERARSLSVSGFDPVRRELGRATLEKLTRERNINENVIQRTIEHAKRNLFKEIKMDGDKISRELKLDNLNPEIKNMMGALMYRYSFTQNQYYHCAEVGHLCGLLAAELGEITKDGRRAGLLHDIGKAMDHSLDGGHAVIGADFIEKHGEPSHIVHAVRAHHFDETPSTNLAYLVIAADAISGARPGARRSTTSTYTQKMDQLQEIGNSFEGVIDTFILSAGREVRITVDNNKIDDHKALELSKQIARKIEHDCNYPGTIKVTIVRETQSIDIAR